MANLKCSVRNCSYNEDNLCCLTKISVGNQGSSNPNATDCESFVESEYVASNCAMEPQDCVDIKCSATQCVFNVAHECQAVEVAINSSSTACHYEDTCCDTFISE